MIATISNSCPSVPSCCKVTVSPVSTSSRRAIFSVRIIPSSGRERACPLSRSRRVTKGDAEISLTPKEFDILYFLARNRGEVFTKEQIYQAVWENDYLLDDSNIMAFIRKLRKKIEPNPDAPEYILTIWESDISLTIKQNKTLLTKSQGNRKVLAM